MELNRYITGLGHQDLQDEIEALNEDGYTVIQVLQITPSIYSILAAALHLLPAEQDEVIKRRQAAKNAGR